jgi:hypothetical protein
MKKIITVILLLGFLTTAEAQDLLSIRQVFDYSTGDKFHRSGKANGQPPNCDRITITGKYFSGNGDTLFYVRSHDSYQSQIIWSEPPSLEYVFSKMTDTVFYTNLDSSITKYANWKPYDSSMYVYEIINLTSERYCDSIINGYHYELNSFEPDIYIAQYGKGLGLVNNYYFSASSSSNVVWNEELIYYEKNGVGCGTPDNRTISIQEASSFNHLSICPNPATDNFSFDTGNPEFLTLKIYNLKGELQLAERINSSNQYNCSHLPSGIYAVVCESQSNKYVGKLVKK